MEVEPYQPVGNLAPFRQAVLEEVDRIKNVSEVLIYAAGVQRGHAPIFS
jgi:hypothetical protein